MLSRVFGLVREAAICALGATHMMGSFRVAFSIPNLFRRLFGEGAVSVAFVPVFTEVAQAEGWGRARVVLANVMGLLAVILAAVVVIGEALLFAYLMLAPQSDHALLVRLTMIVLPFMFTVCLLALASAGLNCKGHFAYPAFAPILLNLFMIAAAIVAGAYFSKPAPGMLYILAGSVTIAGVVQLVGVVWLLRRMKLAAMWSTRPILAPVKRIAALTLPMIIPIGILQFSAFFDRIYAHFLASRPGAETFSLFGWTISRPLGEGVVTWFDNANRLYQFPMAILGISLATAVFPLFSRYAADNDLAGLRDTANCSLRLSLFLGIPSGAALLLLAEPAMVLLFRRWRFYTHDAIEAAWILRMYCLGMWAYFCNHILLRAFFAQKDARTPLIVSCCAAGLNMIIVAVGVFTPLKAGALGLATAITASLNTMVLVVILRRRWGRIGFKSILASLARIAVATAAMTGVIALVLWKLSAPLADITNTRAGLVLLIGIPAAISVFLVAARVLGCPELGELRTSLRKNTRQS